MTIMNISYMDDYSEFVVNDLYDLPLEFLGSWRIIICLFCH